MSRRACKFTVADVRRATKAAGDNRTVGILANGTILLVPTHMISPLTGLRSADETPDRNPWDEP